MVEKIRLLAEAQNAVYSVAIAGPLSFFAMALICAYSGSAAVVVYSSNVPDNPKSATNKNILQSAKIKFEAENFPNLIFMSLKKKPKPNFLSNSTCFFVIPFPDLLLVPEKKLYNLPMCIPYALGWNLI